MGAGRVQATCRRRQERSRIRGNEHRRAQRQRSSPGRSLSTGSVYEVRPSFVVRKCRSQRGHPTDRSVGPLTTDDGLIPFPFSAECLDHTAWDGSFIIEPYSARPGVGSSAGAASGVAASAPGFAQHANRPVRTIFKPMASSG